MIARASLAALLALALAACGGGGGGGGGNPGAGTPLLGDDARRAVLADLGEQLVRPALADFAQAAQALDAALDAHAQNPQDNAAKLQARQAWVTAALAFEPIEVLQVGPAAMADQPGGQDLRDLIYAYPRRVEFQIDCLALSGAAVDADTRIDAMGLGALEHLLYAPVNADAASQCDEGGDVATLRAEYAGRVGSFIAAQAAALRNAWAPAGENFIADWAQAGQGGSVYARPQDALDALSTALFYVEKESKDRKIACPTGIGASGLACPAADAARVEFALAGISGAALRANVATFQAAFAGVDGGMDLNDLLRGIERGVIADKLDAQLAATLDWLDTEIGADFADDVAAIDSNEACINATSARAGEPVACALHGRIKAAMDTFRSEVVAALSLATPDRAAGDND